MIRIVSATELDIKLSNDRALFPEFHTFDEMFYFGHTFILFSNELSI